MSPIYLFYDIIIIIHIGNFQIDFTMLHLKEKCISITIYFLLG